MAELLLTDYITSTGVGKVINRMVADSTTRLALSVSTGYRVVQADTMVVYELTGSDPATPGDWSTISSATYKIDTALQAAVNDLIATRGGTLVFPSGMVIQTGDITGNYGSDSYAFVCFKGSAGDSRWMFKSGGYGRVQIANAAQFSMRDLLVCGDPSTRYDANIQHFICQAQMVTLERVRLIGLCSQNAGCFQVEGKLHAVDVDISGSASDTMGVITASAFQDCHLQQIKATDYTQVDGVNYGKNNAGNFAWIYVKDGYAGAGATVQTSANQQNRLKVDGALLDEGCTVSVYAENVRRVDLIGVSCNASVTDGNIYAKNVKHVRVDHGWIGWGAGGTRSVMCKMENVDLFEADGFWAQESNGERIIHLLGTTKKAILNDVQHEGNVTYPDGINNAAGAEIVIDGVRYNGSAVAIGN